jgi:hypothetical protein
MKLDDDFLTAEDDVVRRNEPFLRGGGNSVLMETLGAWASKYQEVLNVGSGGYMPLLVKTTHAMDVVPAAEELLRKNGWAGPFTLGSVTDMRFPDKSFEAGICSEVIEHLPDDVDVIEAFEEMNRVCKSWVFTTPDIKTEEPDHRRVITEINVKLMCAWYGASYGKRGLWWFIWKGESPLLDERDGLPKGMWHG